MTEPQHGQATPAIREADVLIIGGGLSGTLLAMHLLRLPGARRLVLVEPRAELGRGEAYSATELGHTLNGNAARMSVEADDADDLTRWLQAHIAEGGWPESARQPVPVAELFPPRGLFGRYAQQRLAQALAIGQAQGSSLTHVRDEVTDLVPHDNGVQVTLKGASQWQAGAVVLATGMFPAARTAQRQSSGLNAAALDPWDVDALRALPEAARVLIIGSGLTMVDALVSLEQAGHRGPIEVYSRHGLLPQVRRQPPAWDDFLSQSPEVRSPLQLLRALRQQCRLAAAAGVDWQAPLDTVRGHIGRLWSQASDVQRRQFVRHVRPWWESHHHRSPPQGDALLQRLIKEGRLSIRAASLQGVDAQPGQRPKIRLRDRGQAAVREVEGDGLINSTGIEYDWRRVDKALPRNLLQRGLIQPGNLGLGIAAAVNGAVVDARLQPSTRLFAMGPPLRGEWWESTAVTDVALQAKALALRLAAL
ncbi:FAD/NAD(P)-binding protein [Pseudomonas sp.]|uniref:FAD/NAD(P)-binding protein n=1 Tax=Pseudomonas sp. TaxID=306 RepID=UPI002638BCEA|nr:FAD/NAD(P)-binding protein [Pseudomonas sp.]